MSHHVQPPLTQASDKARRIFSVGDGVAYVAPKPHGKLRRGKIDSFDGGAGGVTARVTDEGMPGAHWIVPLEELKRL